MFQCDNCKTWFSPLEKAYTTSGKGKTFRTYCPDCSIQEGGYNPRLCGNCEHFEEAQLIQNFSSPCYECIHSGLEVGATEDFFTPRDDLCDRCREPGFENFDYKDKQVCRGCLMQLEQGDEW